MKGAKMSTVLIIEDDMDLQEGLAYSLEADGYSIIAASTMEEGEEQFRKNACDLILLDCNLPDGSGFEFCERIRRLAQTPVLMLTARDSELDEVKALNDRVVLLPEKGELSLEASQLPPYGPTEPSSQGAGDGAALAAFEAAHHPYEAAAP